MLFFIRKYHCCCKINIILIIIIIIINYYYCFVNFILLLTTGSHEQLVSRMGAGKWGDGTGHWGHGWGMGLGTGHLNPQSPVQSHHSPVPILLASCSWLPVIKIVTNEKLKSDVLVENYQWEAFML